MICSLCKEKKLRRDFQIGDVCKEKHREIHCLRCITSYIAKNRCCPICSQHISRRSKEYLMNKEKLKRLFPKFEEDEVAAAANPVPASIGLSTIRVVMLGGDAANVSFSSSMKVKDFKLHVQQKFRVECEMQKLLYKDQILESYSSFIPRTMADYNVQPDGTIQLVKILQTLAQSIEHVVFDFSWGFPNKYCRDYLDASALLYSGSSFVEYVDFRNQMSREAYGAVTHSGHSSNLEFGETDRGRHRMNIILASIPYHIDKVFFTLSSWNSPSIASYRTPRLQFYDTAYPNRQLCSEEFDRAIDAEAVIMCSVCRVNGRWKVYSLGVPSSGNTKRERYCYLQSTIEGIIRRGIC